MSEETIHNGEDDTPALRAAEYVLGLLSPEEELELRKEATRDDQLRAEIARWEEAFARFVAELPPVAPPDHVWTRISQSLSANAVSGQAVQLARQPRQSAWNSLRLWRGLAVTGLAATAAACAIAVVTYVQRPALTPLQDRLVAALASGDQKAAFVATYDPLREQIVIVPATEIGQPDKVPELWLVTGDERVISLGVVDSAKAQAVIIPPELVPEASAGAGLVITLEPPGGAPGGVATGPAIAQGELSPI